MSQFQPNTSICGQTVILLDEDGQEILRGELTAIHGPFQYEVGGLRYEVGQSTDFEEALDEPGAFYLHNAYALNDPNTV